MHGVDAPFGGRGVSRMDGWLQVWAVVQQRVSDPTLQMFHGIKVHCGTERMSRLHPVCVAKMVWCLASLRKEDLRSARLRSKAVSFRGDGKEPWGGIFLVFVSIGRRLL